jgi:hypothetical protein
MEGVWDPPRIYCSVARALWKMPRVVGSLARGVQHFEENTISASTPSQILKLYFTQRISVQHGVTNGVQQAVRESHLYSSKNRPRIRQCVSEDTRLDSLRRTDRKR